MSPYRIAGGVVAVIAAILLAWTAVISFVPDKPVLPTAAVELQAGSAGRSASGVLQARTTMQKWRAVSGPSAEAVAPPTAIGAGEKLNFTQRRNLSNAEQLVADWRRNMPEREQILQKPQFLSGVSSLPYPQANVFEQPEGRHWRTLHNSQVRYGGGWIIFGMLFVLATFLAVRGRVPIAEGESGERIQRFNALERANHWLTSSSFILMALTGLVLLYGKPLLLPLIGLDAYASVARWSAWLHMVFVVPFVIGVILMIALWAAANLPDRYDWPWLKRLGGFLHDSENPPADRFNAGQKVVFWGVVLGGLVLLISGLAMMYPFFVFGYDGMQWAQLIHSIVALLMVALIMGHIYIGSVGMEDAFSAMWSGMVDRNWLKEHHSVWYRKVVDRREGDRDEKGGEPHRQPAE